MKSSSRGLPRFPIAILVICGRVVWAQGTFRNLDFESANLPAIPTGQFGGFVSISNALPGWSAYLGTTPTTQIWHNNYSLGAANISIIGPDWNGNIPQGEGINVLQGGYSAILQAGTGFNNLVPASIAQSSLVPLTSESIQMEVQPVIGPSSGNLLQVTLGGQFIQMVPLSVTPSYTVYAGDISAFAGQVANLTISAVSATGFEDNSLEIDDIVFSSQTVPEPGTLALMACGAIVFGYYRRARKR
jgi:hypothetical protein